MMSDIVDSIARAKFLLRGFATLNLSAAGAVSNVLDDDWPECDYKIWESYSDHQKEPWKTQAIEWLDSLKSNRESQYDILIQNWKNIDE